MNDLTPMMRQYHQIKAQYNDAILMFRIGDFFEMFYEDAIEASKILGIALTSRNKGAAADVPLCGVPHHAVSAYVSKLIQAGKKVVLCDQVEDPKKATGIVKREVIRVVTAGSVLDERDLDSRTNNFLMSIYPAKDRIGYCFADLSTGEFAMGQLTDEKEIATEIGRIEPAEVLVPESTANVSAIKKCLASVNETPVQSIPDESFNLEKGMSLLAEQFPNINISKLAETGLDAAIRAAAAVIQYLKQTQLRDLSHIATLTVHRTDFFMVIDEVAKRNLELTATIIERERKGSLLGLMDRTITPMGSRKIKSWLLYPLIDLKTISARHNAVEFAKNHATWRINIRKIFEGINDLERLAGRISLAVGNARDLLAIRFSLQRLPEIAELLKESEPELFARLLQRLDLLGDVAELLDKAISDDPPTALREGKIIKDGFHLELDELRKIARSGRNLLSELEAKEKDRTGISSLKVGYNKVFGYYIEVTKPHLHKIPPDFIRKQTITTGERYITPELKELEEKVLNAQERIIDLEYELFCQVRDQVSSQVGRIQQSAGVLAELDVLCTFADLAEEYNYCRPNVHDGDSIMIKEGRHPVVERFFKTERFVPNDSLMDTTENQILILTGPNMAGKSTYLRQVALIALMAQMGSFVPAAEASIGIVDRIFTRIGAADSLIKGQSTFMVEMIETARILSQATGRSLVILDEIGRGTSTYDGLSIAWAVVEYLHNHPSLRPRTLFATHYHEITDLALKCPRVKNFNIAVREWNDNIIFLRKIVPGSTSRSYGIQVARLAGLPGEVIDRAKEILGNLEKGELDEIGQPRLARQKHQPKPQSGQLTLFFSDENASLPESAIEKELRKIDPTLLTPIEALNLIHYLKEKLN